MTRRRLLSFLLVAGFAVAVATGAALVARMLVGPTGRSATETPSFLEHELGSASANARLSRKAQTGAMSAIHRSGYGDSGPVGTLTLRQADGATAQPWSRHANGAVRHTSYGQEAVVLGGAGSDVEQYLVVQKHLGLKTWSWKIDAGSLVPTLRPDGSVLVSPPNRVEGFSILPVSVTDTSHRDVTPSGLRWNVERRGGSWWLTLKLDDSSLPLPYVIDPAITYRASGTVATAGSGATTLAIPKPSGLAVDDLMIAAVSTRGGTSVCVTPPTSTGTWTSFVSTDSSTNFHQQLFWKVATAADVSASTETFSLFTTASSCATTSSQLAVGTITAFYDVDDSAPIDASAGQSNASGTTVTAPAITNGAVGNLLVGVFGIRASDTFTPPTGSPTFTERSDVKTTTSGTAQEVATALTTATGSTGTKAASATSTNGVSVGQLLTLKLDSTPPTVSSVTSTLASGSYPTGQVVPITVNFSEPVNVTGTPTLTLNTTPSRTASYASGSGTSALVFNYTVQAGDNSALLDYASTSALALAGGTINDRATNNATLTLPALNGGNSLQNSKSIVVDTTAPTVSSVTSTLATGSYTTGQVVPISVNFSEPVTVTGTPLLALNTTPSESASYASGSGTSALVFNYTVVSGDTQATALDYAATTSLTLNSGTIKDAATNAATLTLPAVGGGSSLQSSKTIKIDTTAPTVSSLSTSLATGSYTTGQVVPITINFSEPVTVTGSPLLALNTTPSRNATYSSGSGTSALVFNYTVQAGDTQASALDYVATTSLTLNSGTIKDAATNAATLTLPTPATSNDQISNGKTIKIDTTAPTVSSVTTSTATGRYTTGNTVAITVNFSENVTVTGTPHLTLNTTPSEDATYVSGSGTSALVFNYSVSSGDNVSTLDYASTAALTLNGGTIKDAATNAATLTLPTLASANDQISNGKTITIDTTAPTMSSATIDSAGTSVTITWSEALDQTKAVPGSAFSVNPNGTGGIAGTATAVSYGGGGTTTTFTLSSAVHHLDSLALTYTAPGSDPKIRDTALST
ncbi:MAG TPA: SwmB domain-containing protein, partial [Gaiellaceae bacterium]|nr:SwmB domain-containing protein [Gaiellaceae bacterium]